MSSPWPRKYATGTGADIIIPMIKFGVTDFAVAADWTPAAGDVKVSKDGGVAANIATLPVFVTDVGWKFVFSDAELTAARINVNIVDSATKAVEDQHIVIETYGNASAQHAFDLDLAAGQFTIAELPQAAPTATPTLEAAVALLYMSLRNKLTTTSSEEKLHDDAGTVIAKSALSDDGTTFTRAELVSGP